MALATLKRVAGAYSDMDGTTPSAQIGLLAARIAMLAQQYWLNQPIALKLIAVIRGIAKTKIVAEAV